MNFSRSSQANLLPLATGLIFFGSSVNFDVFRHHSHIGNVPAYSTILRAMRVLSDREGEDTLAHGLDPSTIGVIRLDNVQNYHRQRDPGIGRENRLNIGLAATYFEVEDVNISAFDLDNKRERISEGHRKTLTAEKLAGYIDSGHLETVGMLQWINTLLHYIPELAGLKGHLEMLYSTRATKQQIPVKPTKIHPLASSSRNETILTDFKAALHDFLEQIGQTPEKFKRQIIPIGGDGLTFDKMLMLKEFLQLEESEFESLEIMEPLLEWWHTLWTDLSRIYGTHWGDDLSNDPSTLGHSAAKIGRKKPSNLKKVDYYPHAQLAYLVLDVRMLDCWRCVYFF